MFGRGRVAGLVSDEAWLQAMLDVEAALARAEARAGLLTPEQADAIEATCWAERFDVDAIGREAAGPGLPVAPLVAALTREVERGGGPDAAAAVHLGATSQDVMDSAAMLVARAATGAILDDLDRAADACAGLAGDHRSTLMAARTLLQQALPTTFGLRAAGWLGGLDRAARRLRDVRRDALAVQFGGAAGTLASLGANGPLVARYLAEELGLAEPDLPWHAERSRMAELAAALGEAAGSVAKIALDVVLLAQTDVGEVREIGEGRGGSSTLPHKRNPVAAVAARACAARTPGLVATMLAAMPQELERGAGTWQVEWPALTDLLLATGSSAAWLRDSLEHLEVDAGRMRSNLDRTGGLALAERVATALAPAVGRLEAQRAVSAASDEVARSGCAFADALARQPGVAAHLDRAAIADLLDPAGYLGASGELVDRALRAHAAARARDSEGAAGAGG